MIFSRSPLTLVHIAEALELANIKSLILDARKKVAEREQMITTFETSSTFRVFLMELKHGARGL